MEKGEKELALGGGTFLVQNKILPGSYINFVSAARASATLSDRGYAALGLNLDWGQDGTIFTVESADFQKESRAIFGYDYTHEKLKGLRDLFKNAKTLYAYRLNSGTKAENDFATARCSGIRGNDIQLVIQKNVDNEKAFDVSTLLDGDIVDSQTVQTAAELEGNNYITFKKEANLTPTVGVFLSGGTNKSAATGADYQTFLDKLESYQFNTLGCLSTEKELIDLFVQYTKRMRDDTGAKFQTVVYQNAADYEGIISIENACIEDTEASLVYWVTGASAGCPVNRSNTNKIYDGEYQVNVDYKQSQLEKGIQSGQFFFHRVGEEIRVLEDVNTFVSTTVDKNEDFSSNQVVRVLDQIGNDIAVLFNTKYLGKVQNNETGRMAFWNDLVTYHKQLELLQAIENFSAEDLIVEKGDDKKSVKVTNPVTPISAMSKLYMTVVVQ